MNRKKLFVIGLILMLVFVLGGCGKKKEITLASKPHTEQYVLAEILTQLIEKYSDIQVKQKIGIGGGTSNIHPAMVKGKIDIYPEYTGTGWLFVLKNQPFTGTPDELYTQIKDQYKKKYHIEWLGQYGFNDTYALAIKKSIADKYGLNTYSDLAKVSDKLVFGSEPDFYEREDGYKGLEKVYGFKFKDKKELDIGLKYPALDSDQVDVINAFSTDGLLKKYDLKVLQDDKAFFPDYSAATLIREKTLKKYPELKKILSKLDGKINEDEMIRMNYEVEKEKKDPKDVAKEFLKEKGL